MNSISHRLRDTGVNAAKFGGQVAVLGALAVGVVVAIVVLPFISAVALPIFALKTLPKAISYWFAYKATLVNGQREKYGRREGENYTRWNGKIHLMMPTRGSLIHEKMGSFLHGKANHTFIQKKEIAGNSPFKTADAIGWLEREKIRVKSREQLEVDLTWLRAACKGLIPVAGFFMASAEIFKNTGSSLGCRGCNSRVEESERLHWTQTQALDFHVHSLPLTA